MRVSRLTWIGLILALGTGCASGRAVTRKDSNHAQPREAITTKESVYFDFDKSEVRDKDGPVLEDIAGRMKGDEKAVAILEGHADPIGGERYNEILAEDRARSVRVYLRDLGADPHRVTITSKGEREPVVTGKGRKELQLDRRVDVILTLTRGDSKKEEGRK